MDPSVRVNIPNRLLNFSTTSEQNDGQPRPNWAPPASKGTILSFNYTIKGSDECKCAHAQMNTQFEIDPQVEEIDIFKLDYPLRQELFHYMDS